MKDPYTKPDIISYAHHAFPLGIILTQDTAENWMLSNYITMYAKEGMNAFNFLVNYESNPFLNIRNIYAYEMKYILHMIGLKKWTIYELKHGVAVELFVDFYYLPLSDQYHRIHYMHEILITGYEEDGRVYYWGYTGNIYKENICCWEDIRIYDTNIFYGDGVAAKLYKGEKVNYQLDSDRVLTQLLLFFRSENPYKTSSLWGNYEEYKNYRYGISGMENLIDIILKNEYIDFRYINVWYEHKKLMHRRMQSLFSIEWCSDLCIIYKELENKWYDILLMAISCNKYNDNRQLEKKKEVVEQIKNVYLMEYKELAKCMNKLGL